MTSREWREYAITRIEKWMKVHALTMKDLPLDMFPEELDDLGDDELKSVLEAVKEDDDREAGEANEFRESLEDNEFSDDVYDMGD